MGSNDPIKKRDERNLLARQIFKDACGQRMAEERMPHSDLLKRMANEAFDAANIFMMVHDAKGKE